MSLSTFLRTIATDVEVGAETVWHWLKKGGPVVNELEDLTISGALMAVKAEFPMLPLPSAAQVEGWFGSLTKAQSAAAVGQSTVEFVKGYIGAPAAVSDVKTALAGVCKAVLGANPWSAKAQSLLDSLATELLSASPLTPTAPAPGSVPADAAPSPSPT